MACTLRGKRSFQLSYSWPLSLIKKGVNVGTFEFVATISRETKCRKFWGLKVQTLKKIIKGLANYHC